MQWNIPVRTIKSLTANNWGIYIYKNTAISCFVFDLFMSNLEYSTAKVSLNFLGARAHVSQVYTFLLMASSREIQGYMFWSCF